MAKQFLYEYFVFLNKGKKNILIRQTGGTSVQVRHNPATHFHF